MKKIVIATRKSALAMWQSEYIKNQIEMKHNIKVELLGMKTKGDVILDTPLAKIGGKGLFTKELEESMLKGDAHIAVHSLKDVPVVFPDGLVLAATSKRGEINDAFLSQKYIRFEDLPKGAKVGTTSLRRRMQLLRLRPDLNIISLRGNINTRLKKLKDGEFDAIILASVGVKRLGLQNEIKYFNSFEITQMIPAMGQGALGIEAINDKEILNIISFLNDEKSVIETKIERDFITALQGGCQVPIGINANLKDNKIDIRAILGLPDGSEILEKEISILKEQYNTAGTELASEFINKGAKDILKRAEDMAKNL